MIVGCFINEKSSSTAPGSGTKSVMDMGILVALVAAALLVALDPKFSMVRQQKGWRACHSTARVWVHVEDLLGSKALRFQA